MEPRGEKMLVANCKAARSLNWCISGVYADYILAIYDVHMMAILHINDIRYT